MCHSTKSLEVHHLVYKDLFSVQKQDLRVLCRMCHLRVHDLFKRGKIRFKNDDPNHRFGVIQVIFKHYYPDCYKAKKKAKKLEKEKKTEIRVMKNFQYHKEKLKSGEISHKCKTGKAILRILEKQGTCL